jgi:hypothetical protein
MASCGAVEYIATDDSLDTTHLVDFSTASCWNIIKVGHVAESNSHQVAVDPALHVGNVLKVNYPAGSFKPSGGIVGGIGVHACPTTIFPARSVRLTYEVYFPADFNPVKGGKLPGLFIGPRGAAGGKHFDDASSCRLMWRKDNKTGGFMAEAYLYIAKTQHASYQSIPKLVSDSKYGDSLWRGILNFNKGSWNKVEMFLTLNTMTSGTANHDGILHLTINGVSASYDKFIWTTEDSLISGINFTTFFGGSEDSWATPTDQSAYFKNVQLQKIA